MDNRELIDWAVATTVAYLRPWADRRVVLETCLSTLVERRKLSVEQAGAARRALLVIAGAKGPPGLMAFRSARG